MLVQADWPISHTGHLDAQVASLGFPSSSAHVIVISMHQVTTRSAQENCLNAACYRPVMVGQLGDIRLVYLDDVIVMGRNFKEHLKNLEKVFTRIIGGNLKLNLKKCEVF